MGGVSRGGRHTAGLGQDIELTVRIDGNETTISVEDGEDWSDIVQNALASITENLHLQAQHLTVEECRVEVDGRRASAYKSDDGRFQLSP
jgi:hypothetical protein